MSTYSLQLILILLWGVYGIGATVMAVRASEMLRESRVDNDALRARLGRSDEWSGG